MIISEQIHDLRNAISDLKSKHPNATVGFVPTMGALHQGHLSLIKQAKSTSDIVVCSIFVNPTQFNDADDLERYPRTVDSDIEKLKDAECDILFMPTEKVIYPDGTPKYEIDFQGLDKVMEGKFRDDHFDGVAMVVHRLFDIVEPNKAFFGLKDFQQVAIIKHMVKVKELNVEICPVPIVRSKKGLALSSRNALLSDQEAEDALILFKTLQFGKGLAQNASSVAELEVQMIEHFNTGNLELEYLEIVNNADLLPASSLDQAISCCIAAFCGKVRLIDNMQLN